ncbi:hypothetical protein, partial [Verminephrobacter eiseniae]
ARRAATRGGQQFVSLGVGQIHFSHALHLTTSGVLFQWCSGLAYLLSEYVIRDLRFGVGPEATITAAWEGYCQARDRHANAETWRRLRLHLGFQTLYRLVGPSRKVWTGHLDDVMKDAVRRWSTAELSAWLQ